jgi:hypothetical protein
VEVLGELGAVTLTTTGRGAATLIGVGRIVEPTMVLPFGNATRTPIPIALKCGTLAVQLLPPTPGLVLAVLRESVLVALVVSDSAF